MIKIKMLLRLVFLFVFCGSGSGAFAWGDDGHRIVGEIAWHFLRPETKIEVSRLLKSAGEPSLAEASTWADRIRSDRRYDWAAPMHYISLPRHWDSYREARDCPPAGCILKAIEDFEKKLSDRNVVESERAEALMFVAHFVGDLHQPLHTGLASDRGGNDIEVRFFGFPTNLHTLWDVYLPAGFVQDWKKYANAQLETVDEQEKSRWLSGDMAAWAAESQRLVHSHAYTTEKALGEDYYLRNREIVAQRLLQGGIRLAAVLNRALGE